MSGSLVLLVWKRELARISENMDRGLIHKSSPIVGEMGEGHGWWSVNNLRLPFEQHNPSVFLPSTTTASSSSSSPISSFSSLLLSNHYPLPTTSTAPWHDSSRSNQGQQLQDPWSHLFMYVTSVTLSHSLPRVCDHSDVFLISVWFFIDFLCNYSKLSAACKRNTAINPRVTGVRCCPVDRSPSASGGLANGEERYGQALLPVTITAGGEGDDGSSTGYSYRTTAGDEIQLGKSSPSPWTRVIQHQHNTIQQQASSPRSSSITSLGSSMLEFSNDGSPREV